MRWRAPAPMKRICPTPIFIGLSLRMENQAGILYAKPTSRSLRVRRLSPLLVVCSCQSLTPSKHSDLGAVGQVELAQDISDVALDGFFANDQTAGNLTVGIAFGNQMEDLALTLAEQAIEGNVAMRCTFLFAFEFLDQASCHMGMNHGLSAARLPHHLCQFSETHTFDELE